MADDQNPRVVIELESGLSIQQQPESGLSIQQHPENQRKREKTNLSVQFLDENVSSESSMQTGLVESTGSSSNLEFKV